jgi:phosphatidylinositol-3-phosphatase
MLIADENKDYTAANLPAGNNRYIIDNPEAPYLNQLASQYASATHEYSLFHPSFKNYLALLTGATISSGNVPTSAPTLVDQMSDAGIPWTAYVDGLNFPGAPSSCDPSATDQEVYDDVSPYYYEYDHNPFWYFTHITGSSECNNVVPYPGSTSLISTLDGPGAPDFVWISPNGCNDGHDATCQFNETESADLWLQGSTNLEGVTPTLMCPLYCLDLPSILSSSWYQSGGIIIITWDEAPNTDTSGGGLPDTDGGQIATLVISSTAQGAYTTPGNDYSILRAIQEAYGLTPLLGHAADPANGDLSGAFGQTVSAPPPSVTGVTPTDGPQGGGALVTINGTHFVGSGFSASDVLVGSRDIPVGNPYPCPGSGAGCFKVINATHISVFMPSTTSAASDDVSVMTPGGTSPTSAADEYTYIAPGAYTAVTPFRICDTRPPGSGIAANQCDTGSGRTLAAGNETITAQITSASGPVPLGAQAVVVNMTAINRSAGCIEYQPRGQHAGDEPGDRAVECVGSAQRLQRRGQRRCDPGRPGVLRRARGNQCWSVPQHPPAAYLRHASESGDGLRGSCQQPARGHDVSRGVAQGRTLRPAPGSSRRNAIHPVNRRFRGCLQPHGDRGNQGDVPCRPGTERR